MPSLPFNGGAIGPDGFDEYRAQGTMWLHRTLQGAPPGDKWYSGSFELLVLWVHYGRPKGDWLASSLAAVLGVGNSAIATSLHQLFLAAEFAQHCRARKTRPPLSDSRQSPHAPRSSPRERTRLFRRASAPRVGAWFARSRVSLL